MRLHGRQSSIDSHFRIQRVKDGLNEQNVHPTLYQRIHLFVVSIKQLVVGELAQGRIAHVGRHRASLVRRTDGACHKAGMVWRTEFVSTSSGDAGTL